MNDCIFCKLANHVIEPDVVYENDLVTAFRDADPQAPTHILCVPKRHVTSFNDLTAEDGDLLLALRDAIDNVVRLEGVREDGYRLVINTGDQGGQTVPHLHIHVLGKRNMGWPPG